MGTRFSARPARHPASCKMGTGSFPGVKCGRSVLLTTHPLLCRGHGRVELYSTHPLSHTGPVTGTLYLYLLNIKIMSQKIGITIKLEGVEKTLILCIPIVLQLWGLLQYCIALWLITRSCVRYLKVTLGAKHKLSILIIKANEMYYFSILFSYYQIKFRNSASRWLLSPSSSPSSYICHGVGPLLDPCRSHASRSLFKGLP